MKFINSWLFCIALRQKTNESNNFLSYSSKCYYISFLDSAHEHLAVFLTFLSNVESALTMS